MNVELVRKLFSVFGTKTPTVKVDEPTGAIVIGPFTISETPHEVKGLTGTHTLRSYILDVDTGDGDVMDLFTTNDFAATVVKAVGEYAEWRARNLLDDLATDAYAADLEAEREALKAAYNEGLEYFRRTPINDRKRDDNPYPYGIAHYGEWNKGYSQGEADTVF